MKIDLIGKNNGSTRLNKNRRLDVLFFLEFLGFIRVPHGELGAFIGVPCDDLEAVESLMDF